MINNNRIIENTWEMLKFLYDELRGKKFVDFDITNIESINDLYSSIISKWCTNIAKEGLYKEYVVIEDEELTSPKGQINIQQSIVLQTRSRGTLVCSYDELSADVYLNHILKGALQSVIFDSETKPQVKLEAQKTMMLFNGVSFTDLNYVKWKTIKYDNSNIRYKHLIEVIKNFEFEKKMLRQGIIDDNTRTFLLFKKQLYKWFKVKYSSEEDIVETFEMPFTLDTEPQFEYKINKNQKLIAVRTEDKALVMCVRLQTELLLDDATLGRKQMEELVSYLREYAKEYKVKPSGCIIYVNTDKTKLNLQPITINVINDYSVGEQVIDMHDQWRFIANKLDDVYKYFIQRSKNMKKGKFGAEATGGTENK